MRTKGKITSWNDAKGFGFITPLTEGKRVFVHINDFSNRNRRPAINQVVTYALSTDKQGRKCAVNAAMAGEYIHRHSNRKLVSLPVTGAVLFLFLFVVGVSVLTSRVPPLILIIYTVASLLTFIMYAVDKSAAKRGAWRIQESTLHFLSLIGGWPGALVAQEKLRHKSKKRSFRTVFWATVLLNFGAFLWLLTPPGLASLQSLIARVLLRSVTQNGGR